MDSSPDSILIQRIKQDDEKAFRVIFDRYYKNMLRSANRILKDQNVSQDAAQDVFVLFWKNRHQFVETLPLKAYLNRAVINKALTILKTRNRFVGNNDPVLQQQEDQNSHSS